MERNTILAAYGKDIDTLFVGIRDIPTERVILIGEKKDERKIRRTVRDLERFQIPVETISLECMSFEKLFELIAQIKERGEDILVNISTAGKVQGCMLLCAAYVNGLKAFGVDEGEVMFFPIMRFSYYSVVQGKKLDILRSLFSNNECCSSLEELSNITEMSLPLVSYHINGTRRSEGLEKMGLVETKKEEGKMSITLSTLGKLLVKGCI